MSVNTQGRASEFYDAIERMVRGGSSVMDSVVEYCEKRSLEIEAVIPLVAKNANLVSRLREEAEALNSVERVAHLPL